ncbi:hypothetical protein SAMN05192552_104211 [Natrinema hispanicum]|uniref:DUF7995 domain-containing protein n=3 Tax=Natrinema hispanicum TaxID=392421 RepID=A0A1I0JBK4_9EURY|nr:hypothetical protein SAMN05192552_104211 [Natrinema hispanicum]SEU07402.1 hypothetical protein SAMN04488694_13719 [Natrinema hispanicum]
MIIYSLVEASTADEALSTGKTVFDRLVGAEPHSCAVFDYYVTFDEEETTVAGKARWGDLPTAAPVTSDEGEELLERAWETTTETFQRNLNRVKQALEERSDDEIMHDGGLARHAFQQVGASCGPSICLYDQHATGIRHRGHLDRLLEETDENKTCWIVPADVHF